MNTPQDIVVQQILDSAGVAAAIAELAQQIVTRFSDEELAFVGLRTRGVTLAQRVAAVLRETKGLDCPVGALDISLYRDDYDHRKVDLPTLESSDISFSFDDIRIVLFDEVIYTGRTIRAALECLMDYGRPARIELAVLVDRGLREVPIQPDYAALRQETTASQYVRVRFREDDGGEDGVNLETKKLDTNA